MPVRVNTPRMQMPPGIKKTGDEPEVAPCRRSRLIEAIARHACESGDAAAVAEIGDEGEVERACTYAQLASLVAVRSRALAGVAGIGDVVMAAMPSGIDYVAWFCAAIASGVRILPLHHHVAGTEALGVARRAGARIAIVAPECPAAGDLRKMESSALISGPGAMQPPPLRLELKVLRGHAGEVVLGSSGTTGLPKLALRDSAALDALAANVIAGMSLTKHDCVLAAVPLCHSYGVDMLLSTLTAGSALHVLRKFDPNAVARQMLVAATALPGVPFIFEALARVPRLGASRVRLALSAGSPLPDRVRREFRSAWGMEVGQLYGSTELGTVSMDLPGSRGFDPASIGRPLPGVSTRLVDPDDPSRLLAPAPGLEGHLAVSAPSMLTAYLDGELQTIEGHLLTGDLARIDADGRVCITGRLKLLIDVGAFKVNPLEVEAELAKHPDVAECVVVPLVMSDTINRLRAVYVPRDPSRPDSSEALRRFLRERLSPNKVPRVIERASSLPRGPTGKTLRDRV